jgi:hypothetical protein
MNRRKAVRSILLFLLGILILSCGTFPQKADNRSIIVISIQNDKKDFDKYYVYYRIYYSKDEYFSIDPKKDRYVRMNFEPGEYEITAIEPVYYKLNQPFRKSETSIKFTCYPNGITILKDALKISFEEGDDRRMAEHAEFTSLSDSEYEQLVEKIMTDKNAKYWEKYSN